VEQRDLLSASCLRYNAAMPDVLLDRVKVQIGFTEQDARTLRSFAADVLPFLPDVAERLYEALIDDPAARAVFTGEAELARQRRIFNEWLTALFTGDYGHAYVQKGLRIGSAHVRLGLPQHFMVAGTELVWREICRSTRQRSVENIEAKLASLHKLLMLELAIMQESYRESYAAAARAREREAVEEKLTQAEHLAEIGRLAAALAHEIKNPLAGISGAIQIIGGAMDAQDPHKPIIREILGQIRRLDATVRDLLLYSRPTPAKHAEFNLGKTVERVLMVLREEPAIRHVRVDNRVGSDGQRVRADEGQIEQMLMNLVLNAADASSEGGTIRVSTIADDENAHLLVEDEGLGMPPEVLARALDPFFTTKAKGTGLGLSICRKIVDAHGGTISLESTVGKGTKVTVVLPRKPAVQGESTGQ